MDGLSCYPQEGLTTHFHVSLDFYVDGQQQLVPPGIGIVAPPDASIDALASGGNTRCFYPVHVHVGDNQVHVESIRTQVHATLGQLFDLWGQPLSNMQVAGYTSDPTHPLGFVTVDASGHAAGYTGDPRTIPLQPNETIVILYNSPKVHLTT